MNTAVRNVSINDTAPIVSVIMPAYGVAKYIGAAIDSVLNQTFTDYEIIVVNDGSPDTEELEIVLARYREHIVYIKHENRGLSEARNTAIRAARGRYLALLDPDVISEPEYLAVQVAMLESDPTIDAVYPNALLFGETLNSGKTFMDICPSNGEVTFESLITLRCQVSIFVTARTEAVVRAGMFDRNIRVSGDFDLWLRIVKQGGRIAYNRQVLARHRRRPESLSSNQIALYKDILRVLDKAPVIFQFTPSELEVVEQQRAHNLSMLSFYQGKQAFSLGNTAEAFERLQEANHFLKSRKISVALLFLRFAPRLLLSIHSMRDRLLFNAATRI